MFCVFLHTRQSSEPIEKKTHQTILRTHREKNTQNNPQKPYRQKYTKQSSELIREKNTQNNPQNP
jgi:hypothetical protein